MKQKWSKKEIELLKKMYPNTDKRDMAKRLNRPEHAVSYMAHRLGLRREEGFFYWTDAELKMLRQEFPKYQVTIEALADKLGRGIKAVRTKANQMGLRREKRPK